MTSRLRTSFTIFGLLVLLGSRGFAQELSTSDVGRGSPNASRKELEQLALQADSASRSTVSDELRSRKALEAAAIRERLRVGDFRAGDRIIVAIQGDSVLNDTLVVLDGPTLRLLSLPDDSLRGVLRSELQQHLGASVTRFYKNTTVRATPLIRLGILGEVNRPGYYRLPVDIAVSDAIMAAGGPTQRADVPKTIVRRRAREILSKRAVREALADGVTLDQLGIDAGDELIVGGRRERNWMGVVQAISLVSGLALTLRASRGF